MDVVTAEGPSFPIYKAFAADFLDSIQGLPTLAANFVPPDREVVYHSENGLLGLGPHRRARPLDGTAALPARIRGVTDPGVPDR